jgi:hypothetical protein
MNNQCDNVREVSSKRKLEGANDSDLEQTPVPSNRLTKGEKRRMRRREFVYTRERAERKQAALNAMGFLPVDAPANIGVIRLERRKDLPRRMAGYTSRGTTEDGEARLRVPMPRARLPSGFLGPGKAGEETDLDIPR